MVALVPSFSDILNVSYGEQGVPLKPRGSGHSRAWTNREPSEDHANSCEGSVREDFKVEVRIDRVTQNAPHDVKRVRHSKQYCDADY